MTEKGSPHRRGYFLFLTTRNRRPRHDEPVGSPPRRQIATRPAEAAPCPERTTCSTSTRPLKTAAAVAQDQRTAQHSRPRGRNGAQALMTGVALGGSFPSSPGARPPQTRPTAGDWSGGSVQLSAHQRRPAHDTTARPRPPLQRRGTRQGLNLPTTAVSPSPCVQPKRTNQIGRAHV